MAKLCPHHPAVTTSKVLWPIHLVRLQSQQEAKPWTNALQTLAPIALPWIQGPNEPLLKAATWVENALSTMPYLWLGVCSRWVWMAGSLEVLDSSAKKVAIHGLVHPIFNTPISRHHSAKRWLSKALLAAAFDELKASQLVASIPTTHRGARGFCLNNGFTKQPVSHTSQPSPYTTYTLDAASYYRTHRSTPLRSKIPLTPME